jgi:hypothetical protein
MPSSSLSQESQQKVQAMHSAVALVLAPNFGDRVVELSRKMPVWILPSAINDHAVREARKIFDNVRITQLNTRERESEIDLVARALYAIDEHHGVASQSAPYDTLLVYGESNELPRDIAYELGFTSITTTPYGFIAQKRASS